MADKIVETNGNQKNEENDGPRINEFAQKFLADLGHERGSLGSEFPLCAMAIDEAIERVYSTGRIPGSEYLADVYKQKPMKVTQKIFVPTKQFPKFNFTGKLLGPKGYTLRRLHEETQCKILIKGRGSVRDPVKEEDLRQSGDPRYAHLNKDLFIELTTVAEPAEAHARIAYALAEIRKYLVPDKNDEVSQEQLRELMKIDPKAAELFSKNVLSKNSPGRPSKFLNIIKQNDVPQEDPNAGQSDDEANMYETRFKSRPVSSPYVKVPIERPPTAFIGAGLKRTREAPLYKPLQGDGDAKIKRVT